MNRNELAYTEAAHKRSRRALHMALRRSAPETGAETGMRLFISKSTISAVSARMVMKKKTWLRTIGPISAISRLLEGSTPFSESSCSPVMTSCMATKIRITLVTRKNFPKLIRTDPLTNITPNNTAIPMPSRVPIKLISSLEFSDTAERIRTVSTPSRRTIRNTNAKSPSCDPLSASKPTFPSIFPLRWRAVFIMKMTMVTTKNAATSMIQPSKMSWLRWVRERITAAPMLPTKAAPSAA